MSDWYTVWCVLMGFRDTAMTRKVDDPFVDLLDLIIEARVEGWYEDDPGWEAVDALIEQLRPDALAARTDW